VKLSQLRRLRAVLLIARIAQLKVDANKVAMQAMAEAPFNMQGLMYNAAKGKFQARINFYQEKLKKITPKNILDKYPAITHH